MQTNEYLDAVKRARALPSDAKLADALGITGASVSALRNRKAFMGDETALKVAEILGIAPYEVLADCHAERARNPETAKAWHGLADLVRNAKSAARLEASLRYVKWHVRLDLARRLLAMLGINNNPTPHAA